MGKDSENLRRKIVCLMLIRQDVYFHTVLFPAMLIGDGGKWTTLHNISSTRAPRSFVASSRADETSRVLEL